MVTFVAQGLREGRVRSRNLQKRRGEGRSTAATKILASNPEALQGYYNSVLGCFEYTSTTSGFGRAPAMSNVRNAQVGLASDRCSSKF